MADLKINDLTAVGSVSGTDQFEIDQAGTTARKCSATQLRTFCNDFIDIDNRLILVNDFVTTQGELTGSNNGTGAGQSMSTNGNLTNRHGVSFTSAGTTTTGRGVICTSVNGTNLDTFYFGAGSWYARADIKIPTLSDATNRFFIRSGFNDLVTGDGAQMVLFRYVHDFNSGAWQCLTRADSVESNINTAVTVVADTWYKLEIVINATATSVEFFINGASQGTITTNIPSGTSQPLGFIPVGAWKTAGTTGRGADIDLYMVSSTFSSTRA